MKLAIRPSRSPIGATMAMRSAKPSTGMRFLRQNSTIGDGHAEHAAVEAHAALPDREDLQRMGEEAVGW